MRIGILLEDAKDDCRFSRLDDPYQRTQFDDVAEDKPSATSTLALVGDFALDYQFSVVDEESGTYAHHLATGIEIDITSLVDFYVTLIWDRIQTPQQASDGTFPSQDDLRLVLSLGFEF